MCEHCRKSVENALRGIGAEDICVSLEKGEATLSLEEGRVKEAIEAIESIGFTAAPEA